MADAVGATSSDSVRGPLRSISRSGRSSGREGATSSTSSGNTFSGKLPLPEDFFPVPQLSLKEKKYLLGLAKHACKEVVYYSRQEDGPMDWLHLSSEDGVDVFQGVDNSSTALQPENRSLTYLRGACKIYATIDEISDFFKLDTPEKLTGFTQTVGKDLLDQKTLLTLASPSEENPKHYVAVKWTAVESPSKLARNRDFCYIECHDEFIDSNTKRRGWVRSIHSIRLPFCPPLHRSHGLVRGSFYRSGYVFTESEEKGCVDAIHTLHVDIKGNAPNWLKIMVMKRRIKNIDEVNRYFQLRRLTQGKLLGDLELPAKDSVLRCQLCATKFGFFHRKRLCRKCGRVVCNACGNEFLLDYGGLGPKKIRICVECSESVVFGSNVPAMDGITKTNSRVKKLEGSDVRPVYDESLSSSHSQEARHFSIDEQEYYKENEDANGMADIEEAKRMQTEFEKLLQQSATEYSTARASRPLNVKSLLSAASASGETQPDDSSSERPQWGKQRQVSANDEMEDDEELGLPPSEQLESMRQDKLRYEQLMRSQQNTANPSGQQTDFRSLRAAKPAKQQETPWRKTAPSRALMQDEPHDALSDWDNEYYLGQSGVEVAESGAITSFHSNGSRSRHSSSAMIRRRQSSVESIPTLAMDQSFVSTSGQRGSQGQSPFVSSGIDFRFSNANAHIPMPTIESSRGRYDSSDDNSVESDVESQRRTQQYFDARNARLAQLGSTREVGRTSTLQQNNHVERTGEHERAMLARSRGPGIGCGSDPPIRRMLTQSQLESPYTSLSDDFTSDLQFRNDEVTNNDDEAVRLAMSAMRMYEEERGPNLQVTEETRQAALKKMVEVYAREIERSHVKRSGYRSRGFSRAHRQLNEEESAPRLRRAVSDDRATPAYGSPLQVYTRESMPQPRRQRPAPKSTQDIRTDVKAQRHRRKRSMSAQHAYEYKDLSDLSSSAFQAFQLRSLGPRDAPKLQVSSSGSDSVKDSYQPAEEDSVSFQRESTSTAPMQLNPKSDKTGTSGNRSGAAAATYGSATSSEVPNVASRPNSMYEVPDSDTFSDMDFTDLPHLMRNDDPRRSLDVGARNSFTDIQRWVDDDTSQVLGEQNHLAISDDYAPVKEPRLSGLLSPLNLEEQQRISDISDLSSNSSSQIDWASSLANKFGDASSNAAPPRADTESIYSSAYSVNHQDQIGTYSELSDSLFEDDGAGNALSESMVAHDGQQALPHRQQGQYHKPHSLSDLLSEYCESDRSSLPSFAEYGAQPELEPEYLEAIKNSRLELDSNFPKLPDEPNDQQSGHNIQQNSVPVEGGARTRRSSSPAELELSTKRELFL